MNARKHNKQTTNFAQRFAAVFFALALAVTMVPLMPATTAQAHAEDAAEATATASVQSNNQDTSLNQTAGKTLPLSVVTQAANEAQAAATVQAEPTGSGITLPGNYKTQGVTIDGVAFHVLYLDESKQQALLLAKDVQQDAQFDTGGSSIWRDSSARDYLNSTWLSDKQQLSANVVPTKITTRENYFSSPAKFIETTDKVFLLSEPDVYGSEDSRFKNVDTKLEARDFTVTDKNGQGVRLIANDGPRVASKDGQLRQWWMRSPVYVKGDVSYVCKIGRDLDDPANSTYAERGLRPAMWVNLAAISKDTTPGSISLDPKVSVVGPGDIVKFNHVVRGADGNPMSQDQQGVTWKVSGGKSWYNGGEITPQNDINSDGRLEVDNWTVDGAVLTITATSVANPEIQASATVAVSVSDWPVKTISKTGSDLNNMVILFLADGFQHDQQDEFLRAATNMWQAMISIEPYRSFANRINVYAMCTDSIESGVTGEQTFFRSAVALGGRTVSLSSRTNHVTSKILGPAFAEKYMDEGSQEANINSYVIISNDDRYGGSSYVSRGSANFHYVCMTNGSGYTNTFQHEMGHNLLGLGDEYNESSAPLIEDNSPNMSRLGDPKEVNWREMLGFGNTCIRPMGGLFLSSSHCMMNDMAHDFCSVCELQGARTMATSINDQSFYVFKPQLTFGEQYVDPDEFSASNYWEFMTYRTNHKIYNDHFGNLTSSDVSDINGLKGKTLSFRTIVQNFSPTEKRRVKVTFEIQHPDGSATNVKGEQEFTIDEWADKDARNTGRMTYSGGDYDYKKGFNSGLKNCDLKVNVPDNADVKTGDKVVFSIAEVNADNTETPLLNEKQDAAAYANVTIHYQDANGNPLPDTSDVVIPMRVGDTYTPTPPEIVGKYKYSGNAKEKEPVEVTSSGVTITYTYTLNDTPKPTKTDLSTAKVEGLSSVVYNGSSQKQTPTVSLNGKQLSSETDYDVSYSSDTTNVGKVTVTINGKGEYKGTASGTYDITPASINGASVKGATKSYANGQKVKLSANEVTVTLDGKQLTQNDFTINDDSYSNNEGVGQASFTISGKGNYQGTATGTFQIEDRRTTVAFPSAKTGLVYTGSTLTGVESAAGYDIKGNTAVDAGEHEATLTLKPGYRWEDGVNQAERKISWSIEAKSLSGAIITLEKTSYEETGKQIKPDVLSVKLGNQTISSNYYDVSYGENTNPESGGTVKITGKGNYTGEVQTSFTITKKDAPLPDPDQPIDISTVQITGPSSVPYNGQPQTPEFLLTYVKDGKTVTLKPNTDYTVDYGANNKNVGTVTVTFTAKGADYQGRTTWQFTITPKQVAIPQGSSFTYDGTSKTGVRVASGADYTVSGETTGTDAKTYTATASLKDKQNYRWADGSREGTTADRTITWTIYKRSINAASVTGINASYNYTGSDIKPVPTVRLNGRNLIEGTDYSVEYKNNKDTGTATVTITGINNNEGKITRTFTIINNNPSTKQDINRATVEVASPTYNGREQNPPVTVRMGSTVLRKDIDYTVSYSGDRINASSRDARVIITALPNGNYTGSKSQSFTIKRQEIDMPTAATNLFYNGKSQTGVPNASNGQYRVLTGSGVLPRDYVATVTPTDNYCWRGGSRASQTISWSIKSALPEGVYTIRASAHSGYGLDVANGSSANSANVQLYSLNTTPAQSFHFRYNKNLGTYTIQNIKSGKYLDAKGGKVGNGVNVQQYQGNGTKAQQWVIIKNDDSTYTIQSALNTNYVLDIRSGRIANKSNIQLYRTNGSAAQRFRIENARVATPIAQNSTHIIRSSKNSGYGIDVRSGSTADKANVQLYWNNTTPAQKFIFTYDTATGYYTIKNAKSGKALDVSGARMKNGTNVWQYSNNGTLAQKWIVSANQGGTYTIKSALDPNFVLDVSGGTMRNSQNIQIYRTNGSAAQKFYIW